MITFKFNKGFTLIEIVISLGILLIGILAVLALFPVGADSAARSQDLTKATIYAQQMMENIKRVGYGTSGPTATSGTFTDPTYGATKYSYNVAVIIGTGASGIPTNCAQVNLTVSWLYRGKTYNENFVTLIPKYNP